MGNRIAKHVYLDNTFAELSLEKSTYYVRDASGNTLAVYEQTYDLVEEQTSYLLTERHIYGSSRLGMDTEHVEMIGEQPDTLHRRLGLKQYELSNHLGNVLSVVNDMKLPVVDADVIVSYTAVVVSATDYSAFGVALYGRSFTTEAYRYGFNGQEKEKEITGTETHTSAEFWMYDERLGRRWQIDPKPIEGTSVYACFNGNPILFCDPDGDTVRFERFRDRVNSFFGRVLSKSYRARFNSLDEKIDNYTLKKRENHNSLISGGDISNPDGRINSTEHDWSYSGIGMVNFGFSIKIEESIEMTVTQVAAVKVKRRHFTKKKNTDQTITDSYSLKNYVPGTDITINAFKIPDMVDLDCDNQPPILLGGGSYQGTNGSIARFSCTGNVDDKITPIITIQSMRRNQANAAGSTNGNILKVAKFTDYSISYTKYRSRKKIKISGS